MTEQEIYNVIKEKTKNKKFFELKDLEDEIKDVRIWFILGKKNIGKSYQIMKLLENLKNDEKVVLTRFYKTEIDNLASQWNADSQIHFFIKNNVIYEKETKKVKGYTFYINNLQSSASLEFKDVKYLIADEIIPLDASKLNYNKVEAFVKFISNIERFKKDLKIYLFGNMNGENSLMYELGVGYNDNIKIEEYVINKKKFKFCFINFKDLYEGIVGQDLSSALLKQANSLSEKLLNNTGSFGDRLLKQEEIALFKTKFNIALEDHYIYSFKIFELINVVGEKITSFALTKNRQIPQKELILTPSSFLSNKYENYIYTSINNYTDTIFNLMKYKKLYYTSSLDLVDFEIDYNKYNKK